MSLRQLNKIIHVKHLELRLVLSKYNYYCLVESYITYQ